MTDKTPDPCGSDSSDQLGGALDAARLALPEFSQQDDYLLAHGASLMSEDSHEILHRDTLRRIVAAAVAAERERICVAIKAADDKSVDEAGYMLDSTDCISIVRGTWPNTISTPPKK